MKLIPLMPVFFSLICLVSFACASQPTVMVTDYVTTPEVMMPGEIGSITVTISNTAEQATLTRSSSSGGEVTGSQVSSLTLPVNAYIESVILKTTEFEVLSGWYEDLGEIGPGKSTTVTFLVSAPKKEGVYFPEIWIRIKESGSVKYPILVNVDSAYALKKQPSLKITREIPDYVKPGDNFSIILDFLNEGPVKAHDIFVEVGTEQESLSSISPERYYLDEINPDKSSKINLSFATDKNIPIGILQIPLNIRYMSTDGSVFEQIERVGVLIQGSGEVGIAKFLTDPTSISDGDKVTLIIRIENTGTDAAKSVRATLDIPFEGSKEAFVGTIEPDNDAPAVFNLKATRAGDIGYSITIRYLDDYGQHETIIPMQISVGESNGTGLIVLLIILITLGTGGYLYMRRVSSS